MCRISGFWQFGKLRYNLGETITHMVDAMAHGGPDDRGVFVDEHTQVAIGHRRLSIIDLSANASQPMEDGEWVISYNGEIYNFKEVRLELESLGDLFQTHSDTEVLLKAWKRWGRDALHKFRGMFAFVIYHTRLKTVTVVRDRVGVKPLYWYYHDGLFMVASELKAFHQHPHFDKTLSMDAVSLFLRYGYIRAPYSIFQHVKKLEPGHILTINQSANIQIEAYWNPLNYTDPLARPTLLDLEQQLTQAALLRMVSDVPVTVFLSGGVDSSLLAALLSRHTQDPIHTVTIGFDEDAYNEAAHAKAIAAHLGTNHREYYCRMTDVMDIIPQLSDIYDEPFGDPSAIPTSFLTQMVSKDFKVALSADGGDEQFAGYTRYKQIDQLRRLSRKLGFKTMLNWMHQCPKMRKQIFGILPVKNPEYQFQKITKISNATTRIQQIEALFETFSLEELRNLGLSAKLSGSQDLFQGMDRSDTALLWDFLQYLPDDVLVKMDRASMAHSLEVREPFLDHELLEYSLGISYQDKIDSGYQKSLLRHILYRYVPKELVDRPKQGFGIPLAQWLRSDLKSLCEQELTGTTLSRLGIQGVTSYYQAFQEGKGYELQIWYLMILSMWVKRWV